MILQTFLNLNDGRSIFASRGLCFDDGLRFVLSNIVRDRIGIVRVSADQETFPSERRLVAKQRQARIGKQGLVVQVGSPTDAALDIRLQLV